MSTVVGNLSLNARENQIGSLFFDVQSDENFRFKIVKVPKAKALRLMILMRLFVASSFTFE